MKTFAILTGGGDCPGLNPAIYGAAKTALKFGHKVLGILDGWKGMINADCIELDEKSIHGIIAQGGTIIGTSRTNPFKREGGVDAVKATFQKLELDGLVAAGGEDTLGVASKLHDLGLPVVGVPKTMDNDLSGTDYTFGFFSAAEIGMDAAMKLHDTAKSHHRVLVLEVMGRHAGWVALYSGIGAFADYTMLPERKYSETELLEKVKSAYQKRKYAIVVVSEGVEILSQKGTVDEFGHTILSEKNIGESIAKLIGEKTGFETRSAVLGHIERGGSPVLFDRMLGVRSGMMAMKWLINGETGVMAALRGEKVEKVPLGEATRTLKVVTKDWIDLLEVLE